MATALVISISAKMVSRFKTVPLEEVTELKEATENFNARKRPINWVSVFEKLCDKNSLEKIEMILLEQLNKVVERFSASACKKDLLPMILKCNEMVFSSN